MMNPKAFLKALLMGRIIPLHYNSVELKQRLSDLRLLLETIQKVPAPDSPQALEVDLNDIQTALQTLLTEKNIEKAQEKYDAALALLMNGLNLDRGDQKKWPHLNSEEKAIRVLTNYYASSPNRFVLERPFRKYHVAYHLIKAEKDLDENKYMETEQDLLNAQEELRHVFALTLGIDLREFREEVETLSQTSNRSEREICLEQFEKFLSPSSPTYEAVVKAAEPLLSQSQISSQFIQALHEKKFDTKKLQGIKTNEALLEALREQPENLEIILDKTAQIDWTLFLKKLLNLPDPLQHCYYRMPDIDRFQNVRVEDLKGNLILWFDDMARLAWAPSCKKPMGVEGEAPTAPRSGPLAGLPMEGAMTEGNPCGTQAPILDVAIIGGGPGGISAAANLMGFGIFRIAVFERIKPNSTVIDIWSREKEADTFYSGPPGKISGLVGMQDTTRAVFLSRMNSFIDYYHLNFRNKERITSLEKNSDGSWKISSNLGTYHAWNIIMTAGRYGKPKLLKWEEGEISEDLKKHVVRGVEVDDIHNSTVLVIGGGNTAFDNVKTLCANGNCTKNNQIYLSYYKKPFSVPASLHVHNNEQLMQWESEGIVKILWNTNSEKVESIEENGKKRWKVSFREGEEPASLVVDYFAPAVGWQIDKDMMEKIGIPFEKGNPLCDPSSGQAYQLDADGNKISVEGLYITGDYASQKSVPAAFITNFNAAQDIAKKITK